MGKFYRGRDDGFTKKVDISYLYRIGKAAVQLRKMGEQMQNAAMLKEVEEIECMLAVIDQKIVDHNLKEHEMPEDEKPAVYRALPTKLKAAAKSN